MHCLAYYHLKNIRSLKPFLSRDALITVVHAFVTSLIDYCNSSLYGIADCNIIVDKKSVKSQST